MNEKSTLRAHTDNFKNYIIETNQNLSKVNDTLRARLKDISFERDDFEEQVDKGEKSTQYMRGLLKNFVEIHKTHQSIENCYQAHVKELEKYNTILYYSKFFIGVQYILILISLYSTYFTGILISVNFIGYLSWVKVDKKNQVSFKKQITQKKKEIKKITEACDFLHNYIDNL